MFQPISLSTAAQVLGRDFPAQIGTRGERGRRRNRAGTCSTEKKIACVAVAAVTGDLANGIGCDYDLVRNHS